MAEVTVGALAAELVLEPGPVSIEVLEWVGPDVLRLVYRPKHSSRVLTFDVKVLGAEEV